MAIKVVNKHFHKPTKNDIYCGRGSALGNPFTINKPSSVANVGTRAKAVEYFKFYLDNKLAAKDERIRNAMNQIYIKAKNGDVNLVCYCAPKACHCDYIKEVVESKLPKNKITQQKLFD
jgi:hypothetical protein